MSWNIQKYAINRNTVCNKNQIRLKYAKYASICFLHIFQALFITVFYYRTVVLMTYCIIIVTTRDTSTFMYTIYLYIDIDHLHIVFVSFVTHCKALLRCWDCLKIFRSFNMSHWRFHTWVHRMDAWSWNERCNNCKVDRSDTIRS